MPRFTPSRARTVSLLGLLLTITVCVTWATRTASSADKGTPDRAQSSVRATSDAAAERNARQAYGKMPLSFEANQGQTDPEVNFIAHGPGYNLFLTPGEAVLVLQPSQSAKAAARAEDEQLARPEPFAHGSAAAAAVPGAGRPTVLRMQLLGANARPSAIRGDRELPGKINYLFGSEPQSWRTGIPTYGQVRYEQVYPGVDVVYYGNQQQLEYDFVVAAGVSPDVISLNYDGAKSVRLDGEGGLVLKTSGGELQQHKPVLYQQAQDGTRTSVEGRYVLKGDGRVGFKVSKYDRRKPLVIDPVLSYLSFVNAGGEGYAIAVDASGFAYVTGRITLNNNTAFDLPPTPGAFQTASGGGSDVFVTKINQAGDGVVYSTFLGGNGDDAGFGIAVDASGNAYVTGSASGTFPVTPGAAQAVRGSTFDAFVTKLNASGSALVYSTFLGGNEYEDGDGIAVDPSGNAYVVGQTYSNNLATTPGAARSSSGGGSDSFVAKFNSGGALAYLTYLGGGGYDAGFSIAVDSAGNAYTTGQTTSLNLPQVNGLQNPGGLDRGFFRSTDAGNNYGLRRTGMNDSYVYAIAVNPTTPTTIYAGTEGGVYKSTDGSGTWNQSLGAAATRGVVYALLIDRNTPSTVYTGGYGGIYKTTDGGATWAPANSGFVFTATGGGTFLATANALASPVGAPATIFAATNSGVYRTTNGAANWSLINTGLTSTVVNTVAIDPANAQIVYGGTSSGGVFKSTNGGASWAAANSGLTTPNSKSINTLAIDPTNSATIYAATQAGVFKSTNGGSSWAAVNNGLLQPQSDNSLRSNPPVRSIVINPNAPNTLYASARGAFFFNGLVALTTVFKSTDGGANWTAVRNGFGNFGTVWSLALDPTNPATVYAGTFGDSDAYLTKINPAGSAFVYSTYLGGGRSDYGRGLAVDASGSAYVSGFTQGSGFPVTAGALQTVIKGDADAFVTKFDPTGATRVFSTLLGGNSHEDGYGLAIDSGGNAYVAGTTFSADFPVTPGSFQRKIGGNGALGTDDAFVAKLNPSGTGLLYASYLGGSGFDLDGTNSPLNAVGVDAAGNAYVVGTTDDSGTFPAFGFANAFGAGIGSSRTFVAKVNAGVSSFSITGHLTKVGGAPIANHGLEIVGPNGFVRFILTDSQGYYAFISLPAGDYTVFPNQFGGAGQFSFAPAERTFTGLGADQTADFVGTPLFDISGVVTDQVTGRGVAAVTVTLSGSASATTTTDFGGFYHFNSLTSGGNYTVTPSRAGYTFTPANQTFTNLSSDQNTANFTTPSAHFYTVSGHIADASAASIGGVRVQLVPSLFPSFTFGLSATTDASGNYSIPNVQSDLNYFVLPTKQRLTFSPYIPTIGNLTGPTAVNFTATNVTGLTGQIAFARSNNGAASGRSIYVSNADGTNETRITNPGSSTPFDEDPAWSPDGAKIAFESDRSDLVNFSEDIYTVNADGTGLVRVTTAASDDIFPAWSPDGSKIAFNTDCSSVDNAPVEIYTVKPDGTGRTQLTNNQFADGYPTWSPDATRLAFARALDSDCSGSESKIWLMNADGSGQTQLTSGTGNLDYNPVFSPDGTKIAFIREGDTSSAEQIWVMNADGTGQTNITPFLDFAFDPTWSPDGTKLAFSDFSSLYVINANGTGLVQITPDFVPSDQLSNFYEQPAWRPDLNQQPANISGRIADANGAPLAGATVTLGGTLGGSTATDANGFYAFRNLQRNGSYSVTPALAGRTFTPSSQNITGLLGTRAANFTGAAAAQTAGVSGHVVDAANPAAGLSGVTVTLSGSASGTRTTDAGGNYSFAGLAPGGNYTVTPARTNYAFEPSARSFTNVQTNQVADFVGTLVFVISGRVTDGATGVGVPNVIITVSGTRTSVTATDQSGNYSVAIAAGGTYSVTPTSPFNVFTPPRADFANLSAPQTANFATVVAAVPTPTPPLTDDFNGARDPSKWNLGTLTQPPGASDPLVTVVQQGGRLVITPLAGAAGPHYNGYVSVNSFDFTGAKASVEVPQAAGGGAETVFALGSDSQNNYRFVVAPLGQAASAGLVSIASFHARFGKLDAATLVLVFQVKIGGVLTQTAIPYDPVQHRFWRFRHDAPQGAILFETSTDNAAFIERFRKTLEKTVSALAVELSAGTAAPASPGAAAQFDNLSLVTNTAQFSASDVALSEGAGRATITVTRSGNVGAGPATLVYATIDNPAAVRCDDKTTLPGVAFARCDYATTVGALNFAPGQASQTLSVPLVDDGFAEGDETFQLRLVNASGASLGAPSLLTVVLHDNDAPGAPNPIISHDFSFFVREQYLDFFGREPDEGGFQAWKATLDNCPDPFNTSPSAPSANCDRVSVSRNFFRSAEFEAKGGYVFNFYKAALARLPHYSEIIPDMASLTAVDNDGFFAKKAAFTNDFVGRPEFKALYDAMTSQQYVDALMGRYNLQQITTPNPATPDDPSQAAKVTLTRADLVSRMNGGTLTRAQVLRAVANSDQVRAAEANSSFVAMQYFGYLRRDPEEGGYNDWLRTINANPADIRSMVNGFMNSIEYRLRFGQP